MADVSIYVAVISGATGVIGASVPQAVTAIRESRRAERDHRERQAAARRQACVDLLRTVLGLRASVANFHDHHGADMAGRLAEIRDRAAAAEVEAAVIALVFQSGELAKAAGRLAEAAGHLVTAAEQNASLDLGVSTGAPDFEELTKRVEIFRVLAVKEVGELSLVPCHALGDRTVPR